jgi:hypothetical protein
MLTLITAALLQAQVSPAPPYWQQQVEYTIEASLDEEAEVLRGVGRLTYHNRSPDTLDVIYLHLHLNAFRPNSRWAEVERRTEYDFQQLQDPDYAFERLGVVRTGGTTLSVTYPGEPDSVVARVSLPDPLEPGASLQLDFDWEARPSTLCRRQCRDGRSYDFAQWYPRVAPYDAYGWQAHTLLPQGEFYGEFGTYDVTLDLASDQVVGATGVPISGDPGWAPRTGSPRSEPLFNRDWYEAPASPDLGSFTAAPAPGRKRVRFRAEGVHHFAWSTSPEYRYEGGAHGDIGIHVLYRPGDEDWADGAAVQSTIRALTFLEDVFGPYPWPQLTNVHRLEGGGTEFPMIIMDGSASQGLILHESAHQYAHGILANNEWREGWLDEGMASFLTSWFAERSGQPREQVWYPLVERLGILEAQMSPLPIDTLAEAFPNFQSYGLKTYTKPSVVLYMLRELLGEDVFVRGLRSYYAKKALQHVTQSDFRAAMEYASGTDLEWFFDQWINTSATLDYSITSVATEQIRDGSWRTIVTVAREGEAWMPLTVQADETVEATRDRGRVIEVLLLTADRPTRVELDPGRTLLDTDRNNNVWTAGS